MLTLPWRAISATTIVAALVVGTAAAAAAAPTPDNGPITGGTVVTVDAPEVEVAATAPGSDHTLALGVDGNVYAWGGNGWGQLGDGTTTGKSLALRVPTPAGLTFTEVAAGSWISAALASDGQVYTWGNNLCGQLGNGASVTYSATPVQVQAPAGVTFTSLTAGASFFAALGSDGNSYAWGCNSYGQLGNGTTTNSSVPTMVQAPAGVTFTKITSGGPATFGFGSDGNLYAWGDNLYGNLGDGTGGPAAFKTTPIQVHVPVGVTFTSVTSGYYWTTLAVGSNGVTYGWGQNDAGQVGDGTTTVRLLPTPTLTPPGVTYTQVSLALQSGFALGSDGTTYAWGSNSFGQLGDGTTTSRLTPAAVHSLSGVTFTSVTAGYYGALGLTADGDVWAWGYNTSGQLGDGSTTNRTIPVAVVLTTQVTGVAFDGVPGTSLTDNGDGTVSVTTPAHAAGPVDVVVSWTLNGNVQPPITYTGGFTYTPLPVTPTITDPTDQTVADGATATFTVAVTGTPSPAVTWEVSTDGGVSWQPITADPAATVSGDGLTVSVVGSQTNNGYLYRATATNTAGTATSQPAELTVTRTPPVTVAPTITDPADVTVHDGATGAFTVAVTGTPAPTVTWEVSTDGGVSWQPITADTADTAATVSGDGLMVSVVGSQNNNGYLYRATATNTAGAATSHAAKLTVAKDPVIITSLAVTGGNADPALLILGIVVLVFGSGLLIANRTLRRRAR